MPMQAESLEVLEKASVAPAQARGGAGEGTPPSQLAVAGAGRSAALLVAREPGLEAASLKRRLIESGGDPAWQPNR